MPSVADDERGEARIGRKYGDDDIHCEVRGGFGGAHDRAGDLIPDTCWVRLDELVDAFDHSQLKKLFTFAKQLNSVLERAQERLREDERRRERCFVRCRAPMGPHGGTMGAVGAPWGPMGVRVAYLL